MWRFLLIWFLVFGAMFVAPGVLVASEPEANESLDWTEWQGLPVFDAGRVMPLDTFARSVVKQICDRVNPQLGPSEPLEGEKQNKPNPLFPDGKARKFSAAELVFSWLVEPENWEDVPMLHASHEGLRREVLDVPVIGPDGRRLKYVSPRQLEQAGASDRLTELAGRLREQGKRGKASTPFETPEQLNRLGKELDRLEREYAAFRMLSVDPRVVEQRRKAFLSRLMELLSLWRRQMSQPVKLWLSLDDSPRAQELVDGIDRAADQLVNLLDNKQFSLSEAEQPVADFRRLSRWLDDMVAQQAEQPTTTDNTAMDQQREKLMKILSNQTAQLSQLAQSLCATVIDDSRTIRVLPSLSTLALDSEDMDGRRAQPWLTLEQVLYGTEKGLQNYPLQPLAAVRKAFARAKAAYLDRSAPDRSQKFAGAMHAFAANMRKLAEAIKKDRRNRLIDENNQEAKEKDEQLLAATAYPAVGALDRELFYNRLDPFLWSWVLTLASIVCFVLGVGALRRVMFFVGAIVLFTGQMFTVAGLLLRASITGMVPVTNMYETVLFVGATVALLGLWFAFLPIVWPVILAAWRVTSIAPSPQTAASAGLSGDNARWFWRTMPVFRLLLIFPVVYVLSIAHLNPGEAGPIFPLIPSFDGHTIIGMIGSVIFWLVGLALLLWSIWFFPRAILTLSLSIVMAPKALWILCRDRLTRPVDQSVARRPFVLIGAGVALLAYLLAYYVPGPVFHREVGMGMAALLRNNFWLALHVLIVTASYGAGALAWGMATLSLGYYTFGRYRTPHKLSAELLAAGHRPAGDYQAPASSFTHRPPAICAKLAGHIYKLIQVAVLLLAAGTITGAIWADYAWGRYWGWDPKEVWALISLLVYLAVLHGRWAGWTGNFGIAVGSVLGATAIVITWYGTNFIFQTGLHSYGYSTGGELYVVLCVAANWLLVAAATVRYWIERTTTAKPDAS